MEAKMIEHKMLHLFGGNMLAHGQDLPGGKGHAVKNPVNHRLIKTHLEGNNGIGIYPMWYSDETWFVKWGCCDIDTGDWDEAYRLAATLRAMGLVPHVERSRSKGWHIWVFSDGPVQAQAMRRALKVAYTTIDLQAREANPKQESLRPDQLGNYVRLPFKGGLGHSLDRQVMMYDWGIESDGRPAQAVEWFDGFDDLMRVDPSTIQYWADKWIEPVRKRFTKPRVSEAQLKLIASDMSKELFRFLLDGPKAGGDRSEALVAFAFKLKNAGYRPDEIYGLVEAADLRWGKYHLRPNGDDYLLDIVERTL